MKKLLALLLVACLGAPVAEAQVSLWNTRSKNATSLQGVTPTGTTGTGKSVYDNTPTLVTPVLGAATATSINFGGTTLSTFTEAAYNTGWDFTYAGDPTGITYTTKKGYYQRVGNWVTVTLNFTLSANGTAAGAPRIDGLPFNVNVTDTAVFPATIVCGSMVGLAGTLMAYATNAASIYIVQDAATGFGAALDKTNFSATTDCYIQVSYRI